MCYNTFKLELNIDILYKIYNRQKRKREKKELLFLSLRDGHRKFLEDIHIYVEH